MTGEKSTKKLPPEWGSDPLSKFIDEAFGNLLATFVRKKPQYSVLSSVDSCFLRVTENLSVSKELLEPLFLIRSHAAYRAGCQLAMSGQSTESFCVFRSCLEFALYGLHIAQNPTLGETWLHRHKNNKSKSRVRSEFRIGNVLGTLRGLDPNLCGAVEKLYERTIDFGGHPNERSITSNIVMNSGDDDIQIKQFYLLGDSLTLEHGLKTAAQVGLSALYICRRIFRERFDILDVTRRLDELGEFL